MTATANWLVSESGEIVQNNDLISVLPYRHDGYAAPYNNAHRQVYVNQQAHYVGSGVGTGYYGVPGSGKYFGFDHGRNRPYVG